MTTCPTPTFKLDPKVLAETVPLRRVGTQQVCIKFCHNCTMMFNIYCRIWQALPFSWQVGLVPMLMGLCGLLTEAELEPCQVTIKIQPELVYPLD